MTQKIKKYLKEIVIFIIMMTLFANAISLYKAQDLNKKPLKQINLTLLNKSQYSFPNDRPILVHVWATWCPICKIEAPNIQMIASKYEVLTIAVKSGSDESIKQYMQEQDLSYKVYNDKQGFMAHELKVPAYPTTFIYNKKGELVFSEVGYTSTFGLWIRMLWADF